MVTPTQCHLWQKEQFTSDDMKLAHFLVLQTFENDSHLIRRLLRCKDCGQLYFYEFYEWIDWIYGNDPQYRTLLPVESEEEAGRLATLAPNELLLHLPRLQADWPSNGDLTIGWIK